MKRSLDCVLARKGMSLRQQNFAEMAKFFVFVLILQKLRMYYYYLGVRATALLSLGNSTPHIL